MALKTSMFTVLVTITHDEHEACYGSRLSSRIQQAIEEGTREHKPFASAMVNTWNGDCFAKTTVNHDFVAHDLAVVARDVNK